MTVTGSTSVQQVFSQGHTARGIGSLAVEPFDEFHKHFPSVLGDLSRNGCFRIPRAYVSQWAGAQTGPRQRGQSLGLVGTRRAQHTQAARQQLRTFMKREGRAAVMEGDPPAAYHPVSLQVTPRTPPPSQGKVRPPNVWINHHFIYRPEMYQKEGCALGYLTWFHSVLSRGPQVDRPRDAGRPSCHSCRQSSWIPECLPSKARWEVCARSAVATATPWKGLV